MPLNDAKVNYVAARLDVLARQLDKGDNPEVIAIGLRSLAKDIRDSSHAEGLHS